MHQKVVVLVISAALMSALIAVMALLRLFGADGACGKLGESRMLGSVIEIGGCF